MQATTRATVQAKLKVAAARKRKAVRAAASKRASGSEEKIPQAPPISGTATYSASIGKEEFIPLCRMAAKRKLYIRDRSNRVALVIDPSEPKKQHSIAVNAQFFRNNFARCASLVKAGMIFKVTAKGTPAVWVRLYGSYSDRLTELVDEWFDKIEEDAAKAAISRMAAKIDAMESIDPAELYQRMDQIVRGVERLSLGHLPFREGQISREPDRDA